MNAPDGSTRPNGAQTIEATSYQPYERVDRGRKIKPWQVVLGIVAVVAVVVLGFLFTARSVALKFSAPPSSASVSGGPTFELGGVYLLLPGEYHVDATADGYEPLSESFTVTDARNQDVELSFFPLPGIVTFDLTPADATVEIDGIGTDVGEPVRISAGDHEVRVTHPRYQPQTTVFNVTGREEAQTFAMALEPNWGDVYVETIPDGAVILIDDDPTGLRTPNTVEVLAGEREISAHLNGYRSARVRLVVAAQQEAALDPIKLIQADAILSVTTRPSGAGITLNGEYVGQSPLELELKSGVTYRVEGILKGYRRAVKNLPLNRGQQVSTHLDLAREFGEVEVAAQPADAVLFVNGERLGSANRTLNLPTGSHDLEIKLDGYASYRTSVQPKTGLKQSVKVRLLTVAEARRRALKPRYVTDAGQEMVLFEPTALTLGASRREPGRRANETLRDVTLTKLFYLSRKEVSNAEFRQFATGHDSGEFEGNTLNKDEQPAVGISWHDAALYCNWLSAKEGLSPVYVEEFGKVVGTRANANGYRLPFEAEWAWAARHVGDGEPLLRYAWGQALPPPDRQGNYADRAAAHLVGRIIFGYNDNYVAAAPVGSYKPNHKDIYDLGGNVAEWIHDFYEIPGKEPVTDPTGPDAGEYRVIKGSSWKHGTVTDLRLSFRDYGIDGRDDLGFRLARTAE